MRLDAVVELVQAMDPATFRDLAGLALRARGFVTASTDGPYDGGRDARLYLMSGQPLHTLVQLSVEKDWRRKLGEAVAAAKAAGHPLLFVSSRRIPERSFLPEKDRHLRESGVVVDRLDAQGIASLAVDPRTGFVSDLLRLLAVPVRSTPPAPYRKEDLRQRVAYACALFHEDAEDLRRSVLEHAVCAALGDEAGHAARDEVVRRVSLALGLAEHRHVLVRGAIDRLQQRGTLLGTNGAVALAPDMRVQGTLERSLRERQWSDLAAAVNARLGSEVPAEALDDARLAVLDDLGALLLASAANTAGELVPEWRSDRAVELRARVRRLRQTLGSLGVKQTDPLLGDLARIAERSGIGRHLVAGELFVQLSTIERSHLVRALGASEDLEVVLDASVAIPLLCARSHGPGRLRTFVSAEHLAQQVEAHHIRTVLPRPYLEEAASHLWHAWTEYAPIVEEDPDLRHSQNAFVAHYVGLRSEIDGGFEGYLGDHGLTPALRTAPFDVARSALMSGLERRCSEYGVTVTDVRGTDTHRQRAQQAVTFALRERRHDDRPAVLVDHDTQVVEWLFRGEADATIVRVLATWDGTMFHLHDRERPAWEVMDPVALGDLLALAQADGETELRSVTSAVMATTEADAERGARIWDLLVSLERSALKDAQLRRRAAEFKQDFIRRSAVDPRRTEVQRAWEEWKTRHGPPHPSA